MLSRARPARLCGVCRYLRRGGGGLGLGVWVWLRVCVGSGGGGRAEGLRMCVWVCPCGYFILFFCNDTLVGSTLHLAESNKLSL